MKPKCYVFTNLINTSVLYYKTFTAVIYGVFDYGKPFQPSLTFVGEARRLP
jgi:hypothetical protein